MFRRQVAVSEIQEVKRAQKNRVLVPVLCFFAGICIAVSARLFLSDFWLRLFGQVIGTVIVSFGLSDCTKRFGIWIRHYHGVEWIWSRDNPVQLESFLYLLDGEVKTLAEKNRVANKPLHGTPAKAPSSSTESEGRRP
jgi:hypothetical protein